VCGAFRRARIVARAVNGFAPAVPCDAGGIDLELPLDALLRQTDDNLAKGFRAIKMKVGRRLLGEDVERVAAMRRHLGDGFPLMVDANMKWSADQAIRAARALAPYDLTWLEEPVSPDDVKVGLAEARREVDDGLYRSRWERATPAQRELLHALAVIGAEGPAAIADIAATAAFPGD